jgi:hypothetical protein
VIDGRQQQLDSVLTHFAHRDVDRGETQVLRHLDVVVADHGQIIRHAPAGLPRRLQDANGLTVAAGKHRRRWITQRQ